MLEEGLGEVFECRAMMKCGVDSNLRPDFRTDKPEYSIHSVPRLGAIPLPNKSDHLEIVATRIIPLLAANKSICRFC